MAFDLPVIDLSLLPSTFGEKEDLYLKGNDEFKKLRGACEELGFFHVVNHEVDPTLIQKMDCLARDMFALPEEEKKRAIYPIPFTGYYPEPNGKDPLPESMHFPGDSFLPNSINQISTKLWPHGNHQFGEIVHTYISHKKNLGHRLIKLIMLSLGLDVSKQYKSDLFGSFLEGYLRMNLYPNTKDEEEPQNAHKSYKAHTDLGFLTILYQDDNGGLQVQTKEGNWFDIKPVKGSFVINLGDCLQMWSNRRYRSAEHRVVYGGLKQKKDRLSIAFFMTFDGKGEIKAPEELINEEHPQKYKVVTFGDMIARLVEVGPLVGGSNYFLI